MTLLLIMLGAGAVIAMCVTASSRQHEKEQAVRKDYDRASELGAQPASLYPKINLDVCIGVGACVEACPEADVLGMLNGKAVLANPTSCIGHGECKSVCPVDAIELVIGSEKRGVDIPSVDKEFSTSVDGIYVVGELGGMGLIYNAMTQALQCIDGIAKRRLPKMRGVYQVLIVGAGPAGLAASCAAKAAKLEFVTLDQERLGGAVLHYPRHKLVMTRSVTLPGYGRIKLNTIHKENLLEIWEDVVRKTGIQILSETKVEGVTKAADGIFDVRTSARTLRAQTVVLALGRRGFPRKMGVPGEEQGKVTYCLLEPEAYADSRVLVVGGGDSAVEAAIALGEAGATVHLAHRRNIFDRIKKKNQARLDAAVNRGQVDLLLTATTQEILSDQVILKVGDEVGELPNDYVIALIGGVLPTKFLAEAGVEVQAFKGEAFAPANEMMSP